MSTSPEDVTGTAAPAQHRVITGRLFRVRARHGWRFSAREPHTAAPVRRPARVAQMLALAHQLQATVAKGQRRDRAALARDLGLSRARITQLLDLTLLAPDIQEELLFLEAVDGREPLSIRALRPLVKLPSWRDQRAFWSALRPQSPPSGRQQSIEQASQPRPDLE